MSAFSTTCCWFNHFYNHFHSAVIIKLSFAFCLSHSFPLHCCSLHHKVQGLCGLNWFFLEINVSDLSAFLLNTVVNTFMCTCTRVRFLTCHGSQVDPAALGSHSIVHLTEVKPCRAQSEVCDFQLTTDTVWEKTHTHANKCEHTHCSARATWLREHTGMFNNEDRFSQVLKGWFWPVFTHNLFIYIFFQTAPPRSFTADCLPPTPPISNLLHFWILILTNCSLLTLLYHISQRESRFLAPRDITVVHRQICW